jgi:hypothetical protein
MLSTGLCTMYLVSSPTYSPRTLTCTFASMYVRAIDSVGTICSFPRVRRNHSRGRSRSIARVVLLVGLLTVTTNEISSANSLLSKPSITYKEYTSQLLRSQFQYRCINALFEKESHWNPLAVNGDYAGIPQGGASQLRYINGYAQIRWALAYIAHRYGTMCSAWTHSRRWGWY